MEDKTGLNTPDDEGAESALADLEEIIRAEAAALDQNNDGIIEPHEIEAVEAAEVAQEFTDASLAGVGLGIAEAQAAEHLADLKRLQAEYVNYRKRVDRDRAVAGEQATARAIESLIPVLDDIAAAREHGDLEDGPFTAIADKLEAALGRLGWEAFGAVGEHFDPALHEALLTESSADVEEAQIKAVAQPGHRLGARILRPARVIVIQPE